jgi:ABC-type antimicrobial peptide transport system permease subunit
MALGARRSSLVGMEIRNAIWLIVTGVALGLPAAWVATKWVESMLFGLQPADPATIAAAVILLTAAALTAAWLPARRASHVDPMTALRHD